MDAAKTIEESRVVMGDGVGDTSLDVVGRMASELVTPVSGGKSKFQAEAMSCAKALRWR